VFRFWIGIFRFTGVIYDGSNYLIIQIDILFRLKGYVKLVKITTQRYEFGSVAVDPACIASRTAIDAQQNRHER